MLVVKKEKDLVKSKHILDVLDRYKKVFNCDCNIKCPQKFTEKMQWLKVYDNNPLKTYCSDKINLRNYCKDILGQDICPKIYSVYGNVSRIDIASVPKTCVIKCNHGSGYNIVLNNRSLTPQDMETLERWYQTDFSTVAQENHYKTINHKIFTEELLNIECEYKVWCFHGMPKFTQCIFYDNLGNTLYKPDPAYRRIWSRHDALINTEFELIKGWQFNIGRPSYKENKYLKHYYKRYCRTEYYNMLLRYSKMLSEKFNFVRIDFYKTVDNKIYLSELTFIPSAGFMHFNSEHTDYQIGKLLNIG